MKTLEDIRRDNRHNAFGKLLEDIYKTATEHAKQRKLTLEKDLTPEERNATFAQLTFIKYFFNLTDEDLE